MTRAAEKPKSPVQDKNYNLLSAVRDSLHYVWLMETYAQDAERQNDPELAEWFRKIQHNNVKAAEQGKRMLTQRLEA
jgi:cell fate (sporulation/competence/biofilm development) regulator YlbF (YheA/YmcA/DUF963 family)